VEDLGAVLDLVRDQQVEVVGASGPEQPVEAGKRTWTARLGIRLSESRSGRQQHPESGPARVPVPAEIRLAAQDDVAVTVSGMWGEAAVSGCTPACGQHQGKQQCRLSTRRERGIGNGRDAGRAWMG
jgi:hypothetical protein